jgi:hypothetical protein
MLSMYISTYYFTFCRSKEGGKLIAIKEKSDLNPHSDMINIFVFLLKAAYESRLKLHERERELAVARS